MRCLVHWVVLFVLAASPPALAVQPDEVLPNHAQEARARALSKDLRCMVCQNQSIDDSDAPLARDMRILVRERIQAGDSDTQVRDFLVARYGEFVLLTPRFGWHTAILWLAPPLALLIAALALYGRARRRTGAGRAVEPAALTAVERVRLADLTRGPAA